MLSLLRRRKIRRPRGRRQYSGRTAGSGWIRAGNRFLNRVWRNRRRSFARLKNPAFARQTRSMPIRLRYPGWVLTDILPFRGRNPEWFTLTRSPRRCRFGRCRNPHFLTRLPPIRPLILRHPFSRPIGAGDGDRLTDAPAMTGQLFEPCRGVWMHRLETGSLLSAAA